MTGRVVDSYTNIQTVKLFSHSSARVLRQGSDGRFPRHGLSLDAAGHQLLRLLYLLNSLLLFAVGGSASGCGWARR
jgi:ATP-binding cassette subfamily B multidrug efflux pump